MFALDANRHMCLLEKNNLEKWTALFAYQPGTFILVQSYVSHSNNYQFSKGGREGIHRRGNTLHINSDLVPSCILLLATHSRYHHRKTMSALGTKLNSSTHFQVSPRSVSP